MLLTSSLTPDESVANPDESVANQFFATKYFFSSRNCCHEKKIFLGKKLIGNNLVSKSIANPWRKCCQPIILWQTNFWQKNWLATLSSGVGNTLAKKYFFFSWQQFWGKKYFVAKKNWQKKLVGNTLVGGWQHSHQGLATLSLGVNNVDNIDWLPNPQFWCYKNGMHQKINPSLPQIGSDRIEIVILCKKRSRIGSIRSLVWSSFPGGERYSRHTMLWLIITIKF